MNIIFAESLSESNNYEFIFIRSTAQICLNHSSDRGNAS